MSPPGFTRTWPSLVDLPDLYPDARNRDNRAPLIYRAGRVFALRRPPNLRGRVPLLAVGSNSYPRQLSDKFAADPADLEGVPMTATLLLDHDVAYCPIRSRKGYAPVTLAERPGAVCLTWLQWLTPRQLNLISRSEGPRYALVGGAALARSLKFAASLPPQARVYAWWFDSVLIADGTVAWMSALGQREVRRIDPRAGRSQTPPTGWQIVPRDPDDYSIDPNVITHL